MINKEAQLIMQKLNIDDRVETMALKSVYHT